MTMTPREALERGLNASINDAWMEGGGKARVDLNPAAFEAELERLGYAQAPTEYEATDRMVAALRDCIEVLGMDNLHLALGVAISARPRVREGE